MLFVYLLYTQNILFMNFMPKTYYYTQSVKYQLYTTYDGKIKEGNAFSTAFYNNRLLMIVFFKPNRSLAL